MCNLILTEDLDRSKCFLTTDKRTNVWSQLVFPHKKYFSNFFWLFFAFILCNYSVQTLKYFQKIDLKFFVQKYFKKWASKVAHNRTKPFYFTVQPRPHPTAQNWFFIIWNLGTRHLFSYLWWLLGRYYLFCIYLLGAVKTRELHNTAYTTNMSTYGVGNGCTGGTIFFHAFVVDIFWYQYSFCTVCCRD